MEGIVLFVVATTIGGIVWGIRLEGQVKLQDQKIMDFKDLINTRFDDTANRLERIERALNGNLRK